jgi:nitroreductase
MEFNDVLIRRYSCRRFLDKPVDAALVRDLAAQAQQVPSWGNTQPWKVYAAAGDSALAIRKGLVQAHTSGQAEQTDIPMPPTFGGLLMDRYRELGKAMFAVLGIGREDKEKRLAHQANNFDAFGAPVLVYVTVPAGQTPYVALDAGAFVTAFCLAASERGLATCILAALARYPQAVRSVIDIPSDESILIGLALGHPDPKAAVNGFRSDRAPMEQVLTLTGF